MVAYTPAILNYPDSWSYVRAAAGHIFNEDDVHPMGYALFVRALHAVWSDVGFVVAVQHLIGLCTSALSYATVRRLGAPISIAVVPAAVAALSPDFLYFEHSILSETSFCFLVIAAVYCALRSLEHDDSGQRVRWASGSGGLLGLAAVTRGSGIFLLALMVVLVGLCSRARWRRRVIQVAAIGLCGVAVMAVYAGAQASATGYFGVTRGGGWAIYSRSAAFAECDLFDPPPRTEALCESTDPDRRGGPDFYSWDPRSPARQLYIGPPFHSEEVGAFGRAAITAQPTEYLKAVAIDLGRYVDPRVAESRLGNGAGPEAMNLDVRDQRAEDLNRTVMEPYFGERISIRTNSLMRLLMVVQQALRIRGPLLVVGLVLIGLSLVKARGHLGRGIVILGLSGIVIPVASTATTVYNWRYVVPTLPEFAAAAAVAAWSMTKRMPRRPEGMAARGDRSS